MLLTNDKTKSSFQADIPPLQISESLCIQAHVDFVSDCLHFCAAHHHGGESTDEWVFLWCLETKACKQCVNMMHDINLLLFLWTS